jgi:outer membrane protein TolC
MSLRRFALRAALAPVLAFVLAPALGAAALSAAVLPVAEAARVHPAPHAQPAPRASFAPDASSSTGASPPRAISRAPTPRASAPPALAADTLRLAPLLRAATQNPSLRAARLRAGARQARVPEAGALPDPTVGGAVFPYAILTARGAQRSRWRAQQSIPTFGTRRMREDVAALEAGKARAGAAQQEQDVALTVRRAYHGLRRVQAHERLTRRFRRELDRFEEAALAQYEVGREGQPAVLKAQIERDRLALRLERLAEEKRSLLQVLARATGRPALASAKNPVVAPAGPDSAAANLPRRAPVGAEKGRQGTPVPTPAGSRGPADSLASAGSLASADSLRPALFDRRPEARRLERSIEQAGRRVDLARRDRWPSLTVGVQYADIRPTGLTPTMNGRDALGLSVGVSLPIWGEKQRAQIEEARLERRQARAELEAFRDEVRSRLDDLRRRIRRQQRQLEILDRRLLPRAETALETTLSAYRTGQSDFLDLLDAERTLFQLRFDRAAVRARLGQTRAELDHALGRAPLPDPGGASPSSSRR